ALPADDTFIDARELNTTLTVEELARTAEDYYRTTLEFSDRYLAKPFADPQDAPDLLGSFAQLVAGLRLAPGLDVLDFGAGACWTTRCLTQFGCAAIALDVSASALELGKQLYARLPPIGDQPPPQFLVFGGRRKREIAAAADRRLEGAARRAACRAPARSPRRRARSPRSQTGSGTGWSSTRPLRSRARPDPEQGAARPPAAQTNPAGRVHPVGRQRASPDSDPRIRASCGSSLRPCAPALRRSTWCSAHGR